LLQALPQPDIFRHHSLSTSLLHSYNEWRRHITSKLESEPDAYRYPLLYGLIQYEHPYTLCRILQSLTLHAMWCGSSAPMTVLLNQEKTIRLDIDKVGIHEVPFS
jgi:hypothetical protein